MTSTSEDQWYLVRDGKQAGPMPKSDIEALYNASRLKSEDRVWGPGFDKWRPLSEVFIRRNVHPAHQAKAKDSGGPPHKTKWSDPTIIVAVISLIAATLIGVLALPLLTEFWQSSFRRDPLAKYKAADLAAFTREYEGTWCLASVLFQFGVIKISEGGKQFERGHYRLPQMAGMKPTYVADDRKTAKRTLAENNTYYLDYSEGDDVLYDRFEQQGSERTWSRFGLAEGKVVPKFGSKMTKC